ncbi:MAG: cyanophycinase [Aquisalinus sp.]|nr:cyanophycinase [Aquisalinus sp.]
MTSSAALSPSAQTTPVRRMAIIGGRLEDDNRAVYREMRRLAGGKIAIFPTASSEPVEVGEETDAAFLSHGFKTDVIPVYSENAHQSAFDPEILARIEAAGSVYFTGGDQAKIVASLLQNGKETPLLKTIKRLFKGGGLLAGSSAGAAMMSKIMILGGTSFESVVHGITDDPDEPGLLVGKGMGFFPHGLVDQHFIKRGRLARLVVAMAHTGVKRGFGIDENTALLVEGNKARICGEYGVIFIDTRRAKFDQQANQFENFRISYLDDGDLIDLKNYVVTAAESKRRVRNSEIAYRAPVRSKRNAFGAYAVYDLLARLVLGDQANYATDSLTAIDPKTGVGARVVLDRVKRSSRCLISTPDDGLRMTAVNFRASIMKQTVDPVVQSERGLRSARSFGMDLNERSRLVLLGSSPIYFDKREQQEIISLVGEGPVGVFAAASSEARRTAEAHVDFFRNHGVEAVDLGITIDNVEYAARNPEQLDRIASMKCIFMCGGNQIRLVETLLHRGEESQVLRAIASAYAHGATLIASSGAVSALSGIMIAGGSTYEALRYGVASDLGHQGLVIQEGVGLFDSGIADQNIMTARRLGRLVVACAEENERYGIGVCEESAVIAAKSGQELTAIGRYGFVTVETDLTHDDAADTRFMARNVKLNMYGPGDRVNLTTGHEVRMAETEETKRVFDTLIDGLMREGTSSDPSARHSVKISLNRTSDLSATVDLECAREEKDD